MSVWFEVWLVLAGVIGLGWIARLRASVRIVRKRQVLSSCSYPGPPAETPKISVVVAAKDEENNIERCVVSLLAQDYPDFEIIVVDDRSDDGTPAILKRLELTSGGRLRVITVTTLREGWFGKNNAMREGVAVADGAWFVFTDADCHYTSPAALSVAMREAMAHEVDFLSITPVLETPTVWEKIIQPVCTMTLMIWFLPHRVNKPKRKTAYANGAFMLMRRSCYESIGGHERYRTEVNEDIAMARSAKGMGLLLRVVENEDLYRTRMYETPRAAWRGWSRIFFGSIATLGRLSLSALLLVLLAITPWVSLAVAGGELLSRADLVTPWIWATAAWATVVLLQQVATRRIYSILGLRPIWALAYPLGAIVVVAMLISAMMQAVGATGTLWRGTKYRGRCVEDHLAAHQRSRPVMSEVAGEPGARG